MRFINPQGFANGDDFFVYLRDSFDVLYAKARHAPKMMSIGLHCRLAGRPGRAAGLIRFLDYIGGFDRVWIATRLDIARHWHREHHPGAVAASSREAEAGRMNPIPLDTLNTADRKAFVAALGEVMEQAPWVADDAFAARPFASLAALYQAMTDAVRNAGEARQRALIDGHPDLAGKAAREGKLTADSAAEQAGAGLDRLSEEEFATFHRLNDAYRKKFGMPFIVCVRRHSKESILREFERRLHNDAAAEHKTALAEIFRIAALRLDQRVTAPDRLKVHGHLSTHVLDVHAGHPAAGVAIELCEIGAGGAARTLQRTVTNADGRTDRPLFAGHADPDRDLRIALCRRRLFRAAGRADVRSAVPRHRAGALCRRRARRQISRAAAGDAVVVFDLSRQLRRGAPPLDRIAKFR